MLVSLCHVAAATFQRPLQLKLLQPPTSSPTNTYQGSSQAGPVCQLTPPMLHRASLLLAVLLLSISTSTILSVAAFPIESSQPVITPVEKLALKARQDNVVPATSIIPDFALQYAPVMYLHSDEQWFPTDVKTFLTNVLPYDTNHIQLSTISPNFTSLSTYTIEPTYLSSIQDISILSESTSSWLNNINGKPNEINGSSNAPIEIIIAEKENGITDVFYFFFFSYNKGPEILGNSFGDHVGDWEHTMIRFQDSIPTSIYLSQHNSGTAYSWNSIIKDEDLRPVIYIGQGDHACYAMPGTHTYDTILRDETNAGTRWDISLNYRAYSFDSISGQFSIFSSSNSSSSTSTSSNSQASTSTLEVNEMNNAEDSNEIQEGVNWLTWTGYYGNKKLDDDANGQFCAFGQCRYTDGPLGPYLKNLGRKSVCQDDEGCVINTTL